MKLIIEFLLANYAIILIVAVLGNILSGVARAISDGSFEWSKALVGIKDAFLLAIGYITFGVFAFFIKDIKLADFAIFGAAFSFITIAIIAYKGNSLAINFVSLAKIPFPKVLTTLDNYVKDLFEIDKFDFGWVEEDELTEGETEQ